MSKKFLDSSGLTLYNSNIQDYIDNLIEDLVDDAISPSSPSSGNVPTSSAVSTFVDSKLPIETTVTIAVNDWSNNSCTKQVTGVTASNTIIVAPAPSSINVAANANFYCSAQASGSLTFQVSQTPTASIIVNIVIIN